MYRTVVRYSALAPSRLMPRKIAMMNATTAALSAVYRVQNRRLRLMAGLLSAQGHKGPLEIHRLDRHVVAVVHPLAGL